MEFKFTEDQEMLRDAFREFIKSEVAPYAAEWDETDYCPVELFPKLGELGVLGIFVPEEYGGVGLNHTERIIAMEEISRHSGGLGMFIFTHHLAVGALLDFGTEEQKQKYLPKMCEGSLIGGVAVTEPGGGSDVAGQKSAAEPEGDSWIINGRKCFITNSHIADMCIISAKTGMDEKGRAQFGAFILEKGMEGFSPGRKEHKLGMRGSVTGDLVMNHVRVPKENLVGKPGQGTAVSLKQISEIGRASMAAICVGILRGCLEESVKFANERFLYGKPIAKLQAIQFHIAENRLDYEAARMLLYKAASLKDKNEACAVEFSMAKHFGTEAAARATKRTIELMGGYGIINEYPVGRFLRDAMTSFSSGGTSEIQRIIIAGDTIKNYS